ncbi:MAG: hypothetical protein J0L97_09060 [Alphaproteobacteria bacterium]|nr:hypothetical protein [Alphaproteobacteria bacterium]
MTRTASSFKAPFAIRLMLLALVGAQLAFWSQTHEIRPRMVIVPPAPDAHTAGALALGDRQFYFRYNGFLLQNFGDGFGRSTPLKDYDYARLGAWFRLMDTLDATSNFVPFLATYYYSQSQHAPDVRYVVDYLYEHSLHDPSRNWWWLAQAVYLARHKLQDKELALEIAKVLSDAPGNVPFWARQMPAYILESMGEKQAAYAIMKGILDHYEDIPPSEFRYMKYFIEERLGMKDGMPAAETPP